MQNIELIKSLVLTGGHKKLEVKFHLLSNTLESLKRALKDPERSLIKASNFD